MANYRITDNAGLTKMAKDLTVQVLAQGNISEKTPVTIDDWDLDRIYMTIGDKEYTIRTWDIHQTKRLIKVRWTLFVTVGDIDSGTAHGEEICGGNSQFKIADYEREEEDGGQADDGPTEMELFLQQLKAYGILFRYDLQCEKLYPLACYDNRKGFFLIKPGEKELRYLLMEQNLCSWRPATQDSPTLAAMRKGASEHEQGKYMDWLNEWEERRFYEFYGNDEDGEHTLMIALSVDA